MTIIETIDAVISGQEAEQKMRKDSLKYKDAEIKKFQNFIVVCQNRKEEIQKEIEAEDLKLIALQDVRQQLTEAKK